MSSVTAAAATHEVPAGGSITAVLERAAPGDTIRLAGGTYRENIVIDVPVTLTSDNGATIRGGYQGNVVHVMAPGTVLEGLHIADMGVSPEEANGKFGVTAPTFEADDDNIIPVLEDAYFDDDIVGRFHAFLKAAFGEEYLEENIRFVEEALGRSLRRYFVRDFYEDHIKRYKKRPIYWLFSSPKGSFQALIYMHRYKSDTVSVILNDYLRNFITKLEATKENLEAVGISASATRSEKTKALKEIEKIKKMLIELEEYEKEILYPLATKKIEIDLDDGVKHNYPLFGKALKKVAGLS